MDLCACKWPVSAIAIAHETSMFSTSEKVVVVAIVYDLRVRYTL